MKVLVLLVGILFAHVATAQRIVFRDSVTHTNVTPRTTSSMGRDFWFVPHYGAVYQQLILSSEHSTTVFIQRMGQPITRVAIGSWESVKWEIPNSWFMSATDDIQRTAVHVWCDSVDLSLSLAVLGDLSIPSDMLSIPPATAWDSSYIIVAPGGGYTQQSYAPGSEFTIVSNADSTKVTVTPAVGILSGFATLSRKGAQPFTVTLNRGQAVQYIAYNDSSLTGTQVTATKPVLVVAASHYAYPCDVMGGTHEWGTRYYSAPYPKSTYKFVASTRQTIFRNGSQFCTLTGAGAVFTTTYTKDSGAVWSSDAPFAVFQFPFGGTEVQLQSVEQYPKSSTFSVLTTWNATTDINLFISSNAKTAVIDGRDIRTNAARVWRDTVRECYRFSLTSSYNASRHLVESDSSVGIYTCCASTGSSLYACGTGCGTNHTVQTDTIPPIIETTQDGKCLTIAVHDDASQLSGIIPDTAINCTASSDAAFYSESGVTHVSCCIVDTLRSASYSFTAYDGAGNGTRYSVSYIPDPRMTHPGGAAYSDRIDTCLVYYWTDFDVHVVDTSFVLMSVDNVWTDNTAFTFSAFSSPDNALPFDLDPDGSHVLQFQFKPTQPGVYHAHALIHTRPNSATVSVPLYAVSLPWDNSGVEPDTITQPLVKVVNGRLNVWARQGSSFSLFNLLGEPLIEKTMAATPSSFDISSVPSGFYLYRIEAAGNDRSGELILEK